VTRIHLSCGTPLDGASLLGFFGHRAVAGVEEVEAGTYRRSVRLTHGPAIIELTPNAARVRGRFLLADDRDRNAATTLARITFDLDADPPAIASLLGDDPLLGPRVRANPGLRVPGHPDPAELALRAVIGQQISVAAARTVAGNLVAAHGEPLERPLGAVTHLFPAPAALAELKPADLPMPRARGAALIGLAQALARGELVLDPAQDPALARAALLALPGIGPWTTAYIELRALGDRDAFLPTDLGVRRALERLGADGTPAAAAAAAERWRPYRAYALQHLWRSLN